MAEAMLGVNGEIIRWAREYYNMQPNEAAEAIGVDLQRYSNWESGQEFPTYAKLKKISEVFRKSSAIFFFPEPPILPVIKDDFRAFCAININNLNTTEVSYAGSFSTV